jgi:acyl-CoA-binding protein
MSFAFLEQEFRVAANEMVYLPKNIADMISSEERFEFYKYYKQGLKGDNNTGKPDFFDTVGNQKWWAWTSLKGTDRATAMKMYIDKTSMYRTMAKSKVSQQNAAQSVVQSNQISPQLTNKQALPGNMSH